MWPSTGGHRGHDWTPAITCVAFEYRWVLRKQPDGVWALWCEAFRLLLDPRWLSEEGRVSHVFWEGYQVSASWFVPLQTRNSSLARVYPLLLHRVAVEMYVLQPHEGTSLYQEGGECVSCVGYFRSACCICANTQEGVMFLLEHSHILCFPPWTGELRPPVVPPRQRRLILSILPSLPFALLASIS